jgi:hypothetical protein
MLKENYLYIKVVYKPIHLKTSNNLTFKSFLLKFLLIKEQIVSFKSIISWCSYYIGIYWCRIRWFGKLIQIAYIPVIDTLTINKVGKKTVFLVQFYKTLVLTGLCLRYVWNGHSTSMVRWSCGNVFFFYFCCKMLQKIIHWPERC